MGSANPDTHKRKELIMSKLLAVLFASAFAASAFAADVPTPAATPVASTQPQAKVATVQKTHKKHRHSVANTVKPVAAKNAGETAAKK
jgi:hypothetical protein